MTRMSSFTERRLVTDFTSPRQVFASFLHPFNKYLGSTCQVADAELGDEGTLEASYIWVLHAFLFLRSCPHIKSLILLSTSKFQNSTKSKGYNTQEIEEKVLGKKKCNYLLDQNISDEILSLGVLALLHLWPLQYGVGLQRVLNLLKFHANKMFNML